VRATITVMHHAAHTVEVKTTRSRQIIVGGLIRSCNPQFIHEMAIATGYIAGTQLGLLTTFAGAASHWRREYF
jgi:hypothetical protein